MESIFITKEEKERRDTLRVREIMRPLIAHDLACGQCRAAGNTPSMCAEGQRLQSAAYRNLDAIAA
jgi:hypothetical protein